MAKNEIIYNATRYRLSVIQARNVRPGDLLVTDHLYRVGSFPRVLRVNTSTRKQPTFSEKVTRIELDELGNGPQTGDKVEFAVLRPLGFC